MILNKNEYKEAVNKIVISDELREKIIHNSSEKKTHKFKRNNMSVQFRKAAGIAACFAFCILSYYAVTNYYHTPVDITINTTPPIQTPDNSNSSNIEDNNIVPAIPNTDNIQNNTVNAPDEQRLLNNTSNERRLPNNTNNTTMAVNSSANPTTNNSVSTDNSLTTSNINQSVQSNSIDSERIEQDDFPPILSASPSIDNNNTPTEIIVGNGSASGGCAGYLSENMSSVAEIEQKLGYDIKVPNYLPDDYKTDSLSAPFGEFAEITYTNETDTLYYRTAKSSEDISGDYNEYTDIETVTINNNDVTIKGNDNLYHNASWFSDDEAFSVYSDNGIAKDTMIDIVKSVD